MHRSTIVHQGISITVVVIHEASYNGGGGVDHGGLNDLLSFTKADDHEEREIQENRGRFLVVLSDQTSGCDLASIVSTLDSPPQRLSRRSDTVLSVCRPLYEIAGNVLDEITHIIDPRQTPNESESESEEVNEAVEVPVSSRPAIHFVGHSLAGGVAALAANILHGTLPMPNLSKSVRTRGGGGRGLTSAHCVGCPPCLSANVPCPFVTSIVNGDDVVSRMSQASLHSLYDRTRRCMKGGFIGRRLGVMSDAVSLTVSGAIGKDKKGEKQLSLPGKVFLVRPRRLGGGSSSIHEVNDGGKESLRAAVLWQLKDILLSRSLWAHHRLEGYIQTLDKVRLKGFSDDS